MTNAASRRFHDDGRAGHRGFFAAVRFDRFVAMPDEKSEYIRLKNAMNYQFDKMRGCNTEGFWER